MADLSKAMYEYTALLELEAATGTKTTRARNSILRSFSDAELTEFAVQLAKQKGA